MSLDQVLSIFRERYRLRESDESAGVDAIKGAMRGEVSIAEVRRVLTEDYELYPQFRSRALAALDEVTETVAVVEPTPPAVEEVTATGPTDDEQEAEPPPTKPRTGYGRKK